MRIFDATEMNGLTSICSHVKYQEIGSQTRTEDQKGIYMVVYRQLGAVSPGQREQVEALYRAAGWWLESDNGKPGLIDRIISGSFCFCVAIEENTIIGIGRALGDGVSDAYIQDVTVRADFRKQGVGTGLVRFILSILKESDFSWIVLMATRQSRAIYERLGFETLPEHTPMRLVEK